MSFPPHGHQRQRTHKGHHQSHESRPFDDTRALVMGLQERAEAVSAFYLSHGYREGQYWRCGDARNTPGQSLYLRIKGPAGKIGRWSDAATGEYGDLLDLIGAATGLTSFADIARQARAFLRMPGPLPKPRQTISPSGRKLAARSVKSAASAAARLFALSQPLEGTLVTSYLASRGIVLERHLPSLRFHPRCFYRDDPYEPPQMWPALIAAATDESGHIHGVHRTWLDPSGQGKAGVAAPRKHLGSIIGHAVRFGEAGSVMMAGEGIETVLSAHMAIPDMPMMAAGSAGHLGALLLPQALRRLYILRDHDAPGEAAVIRLQARAGAAGIEALELIPHLGDCNDDLRAWGVYPLRRHLREMLVDADRARFLDRPHAFV